MPRADAQPPETQMAPLPVVRYPTPVPVTIDPPPSVSIPAHQGEDTIIYQYINNGWWGLDAHARYHTAPSYLVPELAARRAARLRDDQRDPALSQQDAPSSHPRRSSGLNERFDGPTGRQPSAHDAPQADMGDAKTAVSPHFAAKRKRPNDSGTW